ncbi:MAG TPA: phage tail protein [Candidatus Angelobacter sp.]|nr:phage tail protein [Candidatus Angelobacter sp.]
MAARNDPLAAFNFLVEIDNIAEATFSEVTGLEVEVAAIEYRSGADKLLTVRKLPGLAKYTNIVLKRGVTADLRLWQWIKGVLDGNAQRANVNITLLNNQRLPVVKWHVREAWPCKYEGPDLNAKGNDVAIETLELCHEGFERVE